MNKYQEALDYIIEKSCPTHTSCDRCKQEQICNCAVKFYIDRLQELINKNQMQICCNCYYSESACDDEDGYHCNNPYHSSEYLEFSGDYCSHFLEKDYE